MIWNNIELFNVEEIQRREDGAILLRRFPKEVSRDLGDGEPWFSRYVGQFTTGCELRFCGDAAAITLSGWEADGFVEVYRGDFFKSRHRIYHGQTTTIMLGKGVNVDKYDVSSCENRFSSDVWRVVFSHDFCVVLHGIEALSEIRPPRTDEVPALKMLSYGSSITHGAGSTTFSHAYINIAARILGVDVLNKGMGGSCFCEKEAADYIAEAQWDFVTIEIGVNMIPHIDAGEFERRAQYLVSRALEAGKPVFLISPYPHFRDLPSASQEEKGKLAEYCNVLENLYEQSSSDNLVYIKGSDVLNDLTGLSCDLIHPSDYGHFIMGKNLAEIISCSQKAKMLL